MSVTIDIRPFEGGDAAQVRALFITINRLLAPPEMKAAFEAYIAGSLRDEIDRIPDYYAEHDGGFWVAVAGAKVVGMFGLERIAAEAMELRRMYVDPDARRQGIARNMLRFAEDECRKRKALRMELSTSAVQREALALYRDAGYDLVREEIADTVSNKTVGGGIRRFHFHKRL